MKLFIFIHKLYFFCKYVYLVASKKMCFTVKNVYYLQLQKHLYNRVLHIHIMKIKGSIRVVRIKAVQAKEALKGQQSLH